MKRALKKQVLIFTDLDGTLLDHDNYDWHAAAPALALAHEYRVPVIPCTSKTYAECRALLQRLGLQGPFIFENGAGIALPKDVFTPPDDPRVELDAGYWLVSLGMPYQTVRQALLRLRSASHYHFRGIGDMSLAQVCETTGLGEEDAGLAKMRRHGEPLLWLDDAKSFDQFMKDIKLAGLQLTRGGRFIHIMGDHDKGKAVLWLAERYRQQYSLPPFIVALGDSNNDLPMLKVADAAVIVRPPNRAPLELEPTSVEQVVLTTELVGPHGWNEAVLTLLKMENSHG